MYQGYVDSDQTPFFTVSGGTDEQIDQAHREWLFNRIADISREQARLSRHLAKFVAELTEVLEEIERRKTTQE